MVGGKGSDRLAGRDGNDFLFQRGQSNSLEPDGFKDYLDCGGRNNDEATINVSVDHDVAVNSETVNSG